ncbi:hypothetical protein TGCAST_389930, partial [Toxoplasma gondii CAST]
SLVSEYAACGVWRPHTVLPFSCMSLVAYPRGCVRGYWLCVVVQSVCEILGRILQASVLAAEALCERHVHVTFAAQVVPRGLTALWHELSTCWVWRRHMVRPLYGVRLVECMRVWVRGHCWCLCAVCLRDCRAFCSGPDGKRRNTCVGVSCASMQLPHHEETTADGVTAIRCS